jgi:hypothetical protein
VRLGIFIASAYGLDRGRDRGDPFADPSSAERIAERFKRCSACLSTLTMLCRSIVGITAYVSLLEPPP